MNSVLCPLRLAFSMLANAWICVVWTKRHSETDVFVCKYAYANYWDSSFFTAWRRSSLPSWNYTFQDSLRRPLWQETSSENMRSELRVTMWVNWWVCEGFWCFLQFSLPEARFWRALGHESWADPKISKVPCRTASQKGAMRPTEANDFKCHGGQQLHCKIL